jgi:hypothetical protein
MFRKLTLYSGTITWVNMDNVTRFYTYGDGTSIHFMNAVSIQVRETPEQILVPSMILIA